MTAGTAHKPFPAAFSPRPCDMMTSPWRRSDAWHEVTASRQQKRKTRTTKGWVRLNRHYGLGSAVELVYYGARQSARAASLATVWGFCREGG